MKVIRKSQMGGKIVEILGIDLENPQGIGNGVAILIEQSAFVSLQNTGGGFYRAQFGPGEAQAKTPLEALSIAFLRDKGFEVTE